MIYPMVPFSVTLSDHGVIFRPIHALNVLCAQLTRDLFGIAKFLFSRSRSQVEPSRRFLRWMEQTTCFHLRMVSWETRTMSDVIWGNMPPKTPQKGEWIGSFKPKRQNLYIAISAELLIQRTSYLRTVFKSRNALRGWRAITPKQIQHGWRRPSWKLIWRHISAVGGPIWTKFGSLMQNNTPITAKWSKSKPGVEFQYGGLFFQSQK